VLRFLPGFFLLAALPVRGAEPAPAATAFAAAAQSWAADKTWDDGLAEVAEYQAEQVIYGSSRPHHAALIVVKEDFATDLYVKADTFEGRELVAVLKLNWQAQIPTPNYDYHYLTSVFVRRADLRSVVKLSTSSQEWCGNTFQLLKGWTRPPQLETHSYFDGEGDRSFELPIGEADLLEDQLPLTLRALPWRPGLELAVRILDSRRQNRARPPHWQPALIRVAGAETVAAGSLGSVAGWKVELVRGAAVDRYWFEAAYPNRLLKFEGADDRRLALTQVGRRAYWKLPAP
jgi:hypothetical protein